jgi:hypothetical protein
MPSASKSNSHSCRYFWTWPEGRVPISVLHPKRDSRRCRFHHRSIAVLNYCNIMIDTVSKIRLCTFSFIICNRIPLMFSIFERRLCQAQTTPPISLADKLKALSIVSSLVANAASTSGRDDSAVLTVYGRAMPGIRALQANLRQQKQDRAVQSKTTEFSSSRTCILTYLVSCIFLVSAYSTAAPTVCNNLG